MEKIAINLVGGAAGDADYGLRLYNVGNGFVGVTGKVVSRLGDSMFINFTAERRYTIAVEGDLVLSTETDDSFAHKTEGVYGFDVDWSETARKFGNGTGKIFVTNPDSPSNVSVFEVFMGDTPSAVVEFKPNTGNNGTVVVRGDIDLSAVDPVMKSVLSAPKYDDPYACGMALVSALLPAIGFDYGRLFDINVHRTEDNMSKPDDGKHLVDSVIVEGNAANLSEIKSLIARKVPLIVVGDTNMPSGDAARIADYNAYFAGVGLDERTDHPFWGRGIQPTLISGLTEADVSAHEYHRPFDALGFERIERAPHHVATMEHFFGDLPLGRDFAGALPEPTTDIVGLLSPHAFCAHNKAGDCALVDALLADLIGGPGVLPAGLERATLKDLMDSYGDDGDVKVGGDKRDFGQLARTRQHDIDSIERAVAAANALGIETSDIASKRDAALAKLVVFSDRFEVGGTHEVTTDEAAVINAVFGELFGIHQDLDTCVSHWHHYKQQVEATHDRWSEGLASRKRSFRLADDAQDNRVATGYVDYAAKPEETQAASKAAIAELFLAIQRRDLRAAHEAANKGRQFGTREHLLASLIRRGVLVAVE